MNHTLPADRSLRIALSRPVSILAAIALAILVAGCGMTRVSSPRDWTMQAERADGTGYAVVVRDTTGAVKDAEIDPQGIGSVPGVVNPGGEEGVLLVPWAGGSCDERTEITVTPSGDGLAITVSTRTGTQVCDAMAVEHALRLTLDRPIPAEAVTVTTTPG